jgi:hypothetical protein
MFSQSSISNDKNGTRADMRTYSAMFRQDFAGKC